MPTEDSSAAVAEAAQSIDQALAQAGDLRSIFARYVMLFACCLALFLSVAATYELSRVEEVKGWRNVPVTIVAAEWKISSIPSRGGSWHFAFRDHASGEVKDTGDLAPGDFPISFLHLNALDAAAADWNARSGETASVWRSPDSKQYYLQQGSRGTMIAILGLCGLFWLRFVMRRLRARG